MRSKKIFDKNGKQRILRKAMVLALLGTAALTFGGCSDDWDDEDWEDYDDYDEYDEDESDYEDGDSLGDLLSALLGDESGDYSDYEDSNYSDDEYDEEDEEELSIWSLAEAFFSNIGGYDDGSQYSAANITGLVNDASTSEGDTFTLLIYIVGSDLESDYGCATTDINEIMYAENSDNLNIVLQVGGAKKWQNSVMKKGKAHRFLVQSDGLVLQENLGKLNMADPDSLSDFIKWGVKNYPADRYGIVLWNHGGGTISGFGSDEITDEMMSLSQMDKAFKAGGTHFSFIGFDACLMSTIETAYMVSPYADYLIASEETEPGTGWYYTNWITALAKNPGIRIETLAGKIISDFVDGPDSTKSDGLTLSLTDLSKIEVVYKKLCNFMKEANASLYRDGYRELSSARSNSRDFGDGDFEQIDIVDFVNRANVSGGDSLIDAIDDAVITFGSNMNNTHGLAMYFPYTYPENYKDTMKEIASVGINDKDYKKFFNDFVSIMVNGKSNSRCTSPMTKVTGYEEAENTFDYENEDWYQGDVPTTSNGLKDSLFNEDGELILTEKGDAYALSLSDDEWNDITNVELQVFVNDGEGYIDLGSDDMYQFDDDGDLILDYDYTWVAINGQIVVFYSVDKDDRADGSWYSYGTVPAELTMTDGTVKDIDIVLYWDSEHEDGYVKGYRDAMDEDDNSGSSRNMAQFQNGDVIKFLCNYYKNDGSYDDQYYFGEDLTVNGKLTVSYEELDELPTFVYYYLQDIYQNEYWTEGIAYDFDE